jgi:hypothetical protein
MIMGENDSFKASPINITNIAGNINEHLLTVTKSARAEVTLHFGAISFTLMRR